MTVSLDPATILSGQGIDVSSIVQQIIAAQSGQLNVWQNEQTTLATQNGVLDGINNNLTALQTAVAALASPTGALTAQAVTSSQPSVVAAEAQSNAINGTHQIVVTSLATSGTLYTNVVSGGANASILATGQTTGDITLQVGGAGGSSRDIAIAEGSNDTLTTLASYINTQSSANNWGVTASVVTDSTGSRLSLQSQSSGSGGALAFSGNTNTTLSVAAAQGGTNAALTVDNVPFTSSSNTVTGAIQGVTLNLLSLSAVDQNSLVIPSQLTVGPNTSQITDAVTNFVSAYNTLVNSINAQYVVDPTGSIPAPPLEADTSLRSLQSSILSDASFALTGATGSVTPNSGIVNLATLGINANNDGTLSLGINASGQTLSQIVAANPSAVQNFFQNSSGTGFANSFNTDLTALTSPTQGPLYVDVTQNQAKQSDLTTTITDFETQLTAQQTQLTSQYDAVNASLQQYPLLLQLTTETLGSLGSSGSSSTSSSNPTLTSGL